MKFEVHTGWNSGYSIELLSDGKVRHTAWEFAGTISSCPEDKPATEMCGDHNPYCSFVSTLDRVAERHPNVYRAVYEHIQGRTEGAYMRLAEYCKRKNNQYISQYISKFQIIE